MLHYRARFDTHGNSPQLMLQCETDNILSQNSITLSLQKKCKYRNPERGSSWFPKLASVKHCQIRPLPLALLWQIDNPCWEVNISYWVGQWPSSKYLLMGRTVALLVFMLSTPKTILASSVMWVGLWSFMYIIRVN